MHDSPSLPVELLQRIFLSLPDQDSRNIGWLAVAGVCRQWRAVALSQISRPFQMHLTPERAQQDVQNNFHGLYFPLPVDLTIEEISLDTTRTPAHDSYWSCTKTFVKLLSNRIQKLHVQLRQRIGGLNKERIEELLAQVLKEGSLEYLIFSIEPARFITMDPPGIRTLKLPSSRDGKLRVLKLHKCQLQDQRDFLSSQSSLNELSAIVDDTMWPFLSGLRATDLTALQLTIHSVPSEVIEEPKLLPVLRQLSLESTVNDATAILRTLQFPSLTSLKLNLSPKFQSGSPHISSDSPLSKWLKDHFSSSMEASRTVMSVVRNVLNMTASWETITEDRPPMHLGITFPYLPFDPDLTLATEQAEERGALLYMFNKAFTGDDALHACVHVADPHNAPVHVATMGAIMDYMGAIERLERDTSWSQVLLQLHGTTSLTLNARAAHVLLSPLQRGALPQLQELRIDPDVQSNKDTVIPVVDQQDGSLYRLAREVASVRQGKCLVFLPDGDVMECVG